MKGLVFAPKYNTEHHDATGAFQPEALAFCRLHKLDEPVLFDNRKPMRERLKDILKEMEKADGNSLDVVAFFCHGWATGAQIGVSKKVPGSFDHFATELAGIVRIAVSPAVVFYSCSVGADGDSDSKDETGPGPGGDGGFLDSLRDRTISLTPEIRYLGHTVPGHTTKNPYVRVFQSRYEPGGTWLVEPQSPMWAKWKHRLATTDLRFRFPFMTREDILKELVK